jgi:hypothetical protein
MKNLFNRLILQMLIIMTGMAVGLAQERIQFPVSIDNKELVMDWNGGFNAPQFSNIDLNRDGIKDMISFDRQGDILRTYLRMPASGRWVMDWSYKDYFPSLVDWVMVVDYNRDGVEDLMTSSSATGVPGIAVYRGAYENETWSFTRVLDRGKGYLQILSGGDLTNLYCSWDDIPAIVDVDGDTDLDVIVFEPGGSYIAYYANQSIENGWGTDSLRFILKDPCWGRILENELSEEVYLSDNPDMCSDGNFTGNGQILPRHAGSTIGALDFDYDGDVEALLGDIASRRLVFLHNGLTSQKAWITEQDAHFPSDDTSVDLPFFVAPYFVELDDDPEPELLAAVNSRALAEDKVSVWRYDDNVFEDGPLDFELTEKGFLQSDMIDLGSFSRPAVADVNGDGLLDMVVGGYKYAEGNITRLPYLWLFQNEGTPTQPFFNLANADWLGMSQFANQPTFDFSPAFGDIDGNGSIDLIVGEQNGKLFFFKNNAAAGQPMSFANAVYPYMNIAVGVSSTPQIADINGDGLGDLVVGERTGNSDNNGRCSNLNYFENRGVVGNANFNADPTVAPNTQCFGRVLFDIAIGLPQYSTPCIVSTQQGLVLLSGTDAGRFNLYAGVQQGKTTPLDLVQEDFENLDVGIRSAPALADLNHDGLYELIAGNQRGGLELIKTNLLVGSVSTEEPSSVAEKPYHIQVNSVTGIMDVSWKEDVTGTISVHDASGKEVAAQISNQPAFSRVSIEQLPAGFYVVQLQTETGMFVEKMVKQ